MDGKLETIINFQKHLETSHLWLYYIHTWRQPLVKWHNGHVGTGELDTKMLQLKCPNFEAGGPLIRALSNGLGTVGPLSFVKILPCPKINDLPITQHHQ